MAHFHPIQLQDFAGFDFALLEQAIHAPAKILPILMEEDCPILPHPAAAGADRFIHLGLVWKAWAENPECESSD